jgi:hypothetical protein
MVPNSNAQAPRVLACERSGQYTRQGTAIGVQTDDPHILLIFAALSWFVIRRFDSPRAEKNQYTRDMGSNSSDRSLVTSRNL